MRWETVLLVVAVATLVALLAFFLPGDPQAAMARLTLAIGYGLLILVFLYGLLVLLRMATGEIDLKLLLGEDGGGASMSRFQLLIFTFVISLSFFLLVAKQGRFPELSAEVLTLLGISATTYGVSKGIQASKPGGLTGKTDDPPTGKGGTKDKEPEKKDA